MEQRKNEENDDKDRLNLLLYIRVNELRFMILMKMSMRLPIGCKQID